VRLEQNWIIFRVALQELRKISDNSDDNPEAFDILKNRLQDGSDPAIQALIIEALAYDSKVSPELLEIFCKAAKITPFSNVPNWDLHPQRASLKALITHYSAHPQTIALLHDRAINDPDEQLREWAQQQIEQQKDHS
jgi:hypothetical protein